MPDFHTDLEFSKTLLSVSRNVMVKAVSVSWKKNLTLGKSVRDLIIPWNVIRREAHDRGSYIVILRLRRNTKISVGNLGATQFQKGYYVYIGSARRNLLKRIARHQRKRKNHFWHIDYLREYADFCVSLPVRASTHLECEIASALNRISHWSVPSFGSSDCGCHSHLFGMHHNPDLFPPFIQLLIDFRINRLESILHSMIRQCSKGL